MKSEIIKRVNDDRIDALERAMVDGLDPVECPLVHRFTDGMYIREIFMPKGSLVTSEIHNTEHPYTISKGSVKVSIDGSQWEDLQAPYTGITKKGTRRVLFILEDCVWTTYHPIKFIKSSDNYLSDEEKEKIVQKIENMILDKYTNKLLQGRESKLLKK